MKFFVYVHRERWEWDGFAYDMLTDAEQAARHAVEDGAVEAQVFQLMATARKEIVLRNEA